jgi:hypothetical protein
MCGAMSARDGWEDGIQLFLPKLLGCWTSMCSSPDKTNRWLPRHSRVTG